MKTKYLVLLPALALLAVAATVVTPGKKTSEYPNIAVPDDLDMFLMARTNIAVPTNANHKYGQLFTRVTNVVNTVGTIVSNGVITEIVTASNSLAGNGFARLEIQTNTVRLGLVTNINWTYGMTGSVSSATAILGVDDSAANASVSNGLFTIISEATNTFAYSLHTNQSLLSIQKFPQDGSFWYTGTNGFPLTNGQRRGSFEFTPSSESLHIGSLENNGGGTKFIAGISNYWNVTNTGYGSTIIGSNNLAQAAYSIAFGVGNQVYSNAGTSAILSGTNSLISTNSSQSVIAGGQNNTIHNDTTLAMIGGGLDNTINSGGQFGFIGSGEANSISASSQDCVIVGGSDNDIRGAGGSFGFIGGGQINKVQGISSHSSIVGGHGNVIGEAITGPAIRSFIGGGRGNWVRGDSLESSVVGGFNNMMFNSSPHCFIGGGWTNSIGDSSGASSILGGVANSIANSTTNAHVIGSFQTNATRFSVRIGTSIETNFLHISGHATTNIGVFHSPQDSYFTSTIIGSGAGSTNYTLLAGTNQMYMGSSNVNISAVMQTVSGQMRRWSANITNLSGDTWGIGFSSVTNRWKFQSWMYGTNAPNVLTNNTVLVLDGKSDGTNTLVEFKYFSPAL